MNYMSLKNHNSVGLHKDYQHGIKSFKVMSSKRRRRCLNDQIFVYGDVSRAHYDIAVYCVLIPCINYRCFYQ